MNDKRIKTISFIVFSVYILLVLKLTIFRSGVLYEERQLNLTLFSDLFLVYKNEGLRRFLWLFLGNIGWFVPFGFLLPTLLKKESFLRILVIGFMFSFAIESLQFIFRIGVAELDDLILNTLGIAIGYLIYKLWLRYKNVRNGGKAQK